jgi:hypothetical protein
MVNMQMSFVAAVLLAAAGAAPGSAEGPVAPFESPDELAPQNRIDELVFGRLAELGIRPARDCSDAVFLRRAHLDVIGTLPTLDEAKEFLLDRSPNKRRELVERLLARPEFADYWAMKWGDVLRVKAEFPINLWPNAVQAYHRWIRTAIDENTPYDQFARSILTSSGSNFREPEVNFYRGMQSKAPEAIAEAVALTFMGARTENWPKERLEGMAGFFARIGYKETSEWKEEIVFFDTLGVAGGAKAEHPDPVFPDGTPAVLSPGQDPRQALADWLIAEENPWFAKNVVNRVWYWLLGRGIIHEPDDIRPDNPPSNPELLAWLERELVSSGYDLKHVYRLILNSKTYQLSAIPQSDDPQAGANFASYPIRQLDAEVLIDAICQITGTTEEYSSPVPEPFAFIPEGERSIALADGSTTSPFLELFGRPPRDTGLVSERNTRPTAGQRLHLLNSSHIQRKLQESDKLRLLIQSRRNPQEMVAGIYLTVLSRLPTEKEKQALQAYSESGAASGQEILVDLAWALVNSGEFLNRH